MVLIFLVSVSNIFQSPNNEKDKQNSNYNKNYTNKVHENAFIEFSFKCRNILIVNAAKNSTFPHSCLVVYE